MPKFKFTKLQLAVHVGALLPLALLIWDASQQNLTANPIQAITLRTGKAALVLLMLSLAATPANVLFGFKQALKARRALGLYAFGYAALHLLIFVGLDYGFDLRLIALELVEKRYVLAGSSAFLILLPLAVTSTQGWQRRLKRGWKRLHNLVYLAGILVIVHYIWLTKNHRGEPLVWAAILAVLLLLRLPAIRKRAGNLRKRANLNRFPTPAS